MVWPYLRVKRFQGHPKINKKRELFPWQLLAFPRSLHVTVTMKPNAGILTRFPFDVGGCQDHWGLLPTAPFTRLIRVLGSINSRQIAVLMKPFSTSAYKVLAYIFATTTKICTNGRCTPGHPKSFSATVTFVYSNGCPCHRHNPLGAV